MKWKIAESDESDSESGSLSSFGDIVRYTVFIPVRNNNGQEIPHILAEFRRSLTQAGFHGRTVIRRAQGDWKDFETEEIDMVMIDAANDPETLETIKSLAEQVKIEAEQEKIYMSIQPIITYLI